MDERNFLTRAFFKATRDQHEMTASAKDWVSLGYLAVRSEHLDPLQVGFDALELLPDYQRLVQAEAENFGN